MTNELLKCTVIHCYMNKCAVICVKQMKEVLIMIYEKLVKKLGYFLLILMIFKSNN